MSSGSQQYHLIIFIYPSALFLALFKLPIFKMQNLIFGRCLIFQPSFLGAALLQSVPVERVYQWVLLSLHFTGWCRGTGGAVHPLFCTGGVWGCRWSGAFGCWVSEGLRCSDRWMDTSCPFRGCTFLHSPKPEQGVKLPPAPSNGSRCFQGRWFFSWVCVLSPSEVSLL